jgi:hypothetical protein
MTFIAHLRSRLRFARRLAPAVLSVSLVACGSSGPGGGTTNGAAMTDTNNYKATSSMKIPIIQTAAKSDLMLDWSGIQKDLLCHDAAKSPIVNVTFAIFKNRTPEALESELSVGIFNTAEVSKYFFLGVDANTKTAKLTDLKATKTPVDPATDYVESSSTLYLLIFANSQTPGVGAESMVFLQPTGSSTNTTVMAPDACVNKVLSFSAMLGTPLEVPNNAPYTVDWSKLTKDGFGNPIDFTTIQKVEVGYYPGKTANDLMANFLDVELDAIPLYSADVPSMQKSIDLANAKTTSDGTAFPGFMPMGSDVYAMALLCKNCSVPAPIAFTVLQPK